MGIVIVKQVEVVQILVELVLLNIENFKIFYNEIFENYRQEIFNNEYRVLERVVFIVMIIIGVVKY